MLRREFILGEQKYIKFEATSCDGMPVVITGASYTLSEGENIVDSGICMIDGAEILALIEPKNLGDYILEVTYHVAPETRKVRVAIHVT